MREYYNNLTVENTRELNSLKTKQTLAVDSLKSFTKRLSGSYDKRFFANGSPNKWNFTVTFKPKNKDMKQIINLSTFQRVGNSDVIGATAPPESGMAPAWTVRTWKKPQTSNSEIKWNITIHFNKYYGDEYLYLKFVVSGTDDGTLSIG